MRQDLRITETPSSKREKVYDLNATWLSTNSAIAGANSKDRNSEKYGDFNQK